MQQQMQQQSDEWLEYRKSKIGASDAPVIMGVSPWKTPYQLWLEKIQPKSKIHKTESMQRGLDLEPKARECFENITGLMFTPMIKVHKQYDWMIASLDGIDYDQKVIVEIKCPGNADHQIASQGKIPEKYIPQLQHQLEVCGLDMAYYFSFDGKNGISVKVYRDEKYIKNMVEKEKEFFECMQNFIAPQACDKDYQLRNDEVSSFIATELLLVKKNINELEKKANQLETDLKKICGLENTKGKGFKLTKTLRKGFINYASIPELKDVNTEIYRNPPIEVWRVTGDKQ